MGVYFGHIVHNRVPPSLKNSKGEGLQTDLHRACATIDDSVLFFSHGLNIINHNMTTVTLITKGKAVIFLLKSNQYFVNGNAKLLDTLHRTKSSRSCIHISI